MIPPVSLQFDWVGATNKAPLPPFSATYLPPPLKTWAPTAVSHGQVADFDLSVFNGADINVLDICSGNVPDRARGSPIDRSLMVVFIDSGATRSVMVIPRDCGHKHGKLREKHQFAYRIAFGRGDCQTTDKFVWYCMGGKWHKALSFALNQTRQSSINCLLELRSLQPLATSVLVFISIPKGNSVAATQRLRFALIYRRRAGVQQPSVDTGVSEMATGLSLDGSVEVNVIDTYVDPAEYEVSIDQLAAGQEQPQEAERE